MANAVTVALQGPPGPIGASVTTTSGLATLPGNTPFVQGTIAFVQAPATYWVWFPSGTTTPSGATTLPGNGGTWVLSSGSSTAQAIQASSAVAPFVVDANSIVPGGLDGPAWRMLYPDRAPTIRKLAAVDALGNRTLVEVNQEQTAPPNGLLARPFTLPSSCTGVVMSVPLQQAGNTDAVKIQITDSTGQTVLGSATVSPSTTLAALTLTVTGLTGLVEYQAQVLVNTAGQADFYAGRVTVTPTGGTGLWAGTWARIDVSRGSILDTNEVGWAAVRYPSQSAHSHVDLMTDSASLVVETYNNLGGVSGFTPPYDEMVVFVDGQSYAVVDPVIDRIDYNTVTLPGGAHRVSLVSSAQAFSGQAYNETPPTPLGTFLCGVYVPTPAQITPLTAQGVRDVWVVYGDSKVDFYATPATVGLAGLLRSQNIRTIVEAYGGRQFTYDMGLGASVAACTPFALKLCINKPSTIVVAIGRNDFFGATMTLTQWGTALANLVTAIHNVSPTTPVKLVPFTRETSEPNNSNGDTVDQWRAAFGTVAAANPTFCQLVPWDQAWTVANAANYTTGGIHPNDRGYAMMSSTLLGGAQAISAFGGAAQNGEPYPWNPLEMGSSVVKCWYDINQASSLAAGAAMSVVTAVGGGPTVTLSGTPSFAFNLLMVVANPGTLGTATFKFSIDGGISWLRTTSGNPQWTSAATVALPTLGITVNCAAGSYAATHTYAAGAQVSQINDLSGNGNNLVQATSAYQMPLAWQAIAGLNQRPALKGNASTTFYKAAGAALGSTFLSWGVYAYASTASIQCLQGSNGGGALGPYNAGSTTVEAYSGAGITASLATMTSLHCYLCQFGTSGAIYVDSDTALVSGSTGTFSLTDLYIGQQGAGSYYYGGVWLEWGAITGQATQVQINQLNAYLAQKYNTGIAPL